MFEPPPPNAVLLVTFLNTLFVVPIFLTNDIYHDYSFFYCIIVRISIDYIGRVVIVNPVVSKLAVGAFPMPLAPPFPAAPRIFTAPDVLILDAAVDTGGSSAMISICAMPVPLPPIPHVMPP
jgi:hypothetical protein